MREVTIYVNQFNISVNESSRYYHYQFISVWFITVAHKMQVLND